MSAIEISKSTFPEFSFDFMKESWVLVRSGINSYIGMGHKLDEDAEYGDGDPSPNKFYDLSPCFDYILANQQDNRGNITRVPILLPFDVTSHLPCVSVLITSYVFIRRMNTLDQDHYRNMIKDAVVRMRDHALRDSSAKAGIILR